MIQERIRQSSRFFPLDDFFHDVTQGSSVFVVILQNTSTDVPPVNSDQFIEVKDNKAIISTSGSLYIVQRNSNLSLYTLHLLHLMQIHIFSSWSFLWEVNRELQVF